MGNGLRCSKCGKRFPIDGHATMAVVALMVHRRRCRASDIADKSEIEQARMQGALAYIAGQDSGFNHKRGKYIRQAWMEGWMVAQLAHKEGMHERT